MKYEYDTDRKIVDPRAKYDQHRYSLTTDFIQNLVDEPEDDKKNDDNSPKEPEEFQDNSNEVIHEDDEEHKADNDNKSEKSN